MRFNNKSYNHITIILKKLKDYKGNIITLGIKFRDTLFLGLLIHSYYK